MEPMPMQYDQQPPPVYTEQPKNPLQNVQGILASLNIRPLKEPRGFMKVLQFIFSISAFASTTGFSTSFRFLVTCEQEKNKTFTVEEKITYPFNVDSINTVYDSCEGNKDTIHIGGNFSSDAEFFVAVGVLSLLYSVAALVLYCFFSALYDNNENVPIADFGVHFILAVLWLAGSSAWANSTTNLGSATALSAVIRENVDLCRGNTCTPVKEAGYTGLVISIILGFLNMFLWGSNLWFLYKETRYFKEKVGVEANSGAHPSGPN